MKTVIACILSVGIVTVVTLPKLYDTKVVPSTTITLVDWSLSISEQNRTQLLSVLPKLATHELRHCDSYYIAPITNNSRQTTSLSWTNTVACERLGFNREFTTVEQSVRSYVKERLAIVVPYKNTDLWGSFVVACGGKTNIGLVTVLSDFEHDAKNTGITKEDAVAACKSVKQWHFVLIGGSKPLQEVKESMIPFGTSNVVWRIGIE